MIKYSATIDVVKSVGIISTITFNNQKNNISGDVNIYNSDSTHIEFRDKLFILSDDATGTKGSRLDGNSIFSQDNGANFFISNTWAIDSIVATISGIGFKSFTLYFDKSRQQFPKLINIYSDSTLTTLIKTLTIEIPQARIVLDDIYNTVYISFEDWAVPNFPYMVCTIMNGIKINFDNSSLLDFNFTKSQIENNQQVKYGLIAQSGIMNVKDIGGFLGELADDNVLTADQDIQIFMNSGHGDRSIGVFKSNIWRYNNGEYSASIEIKDNIMRLQNIMYDGLPLSASTSKSLLSLYDILRAFTENIGYAFETSGRLINGLTQSHNDYCSSVNLKYQILDSANLWATWDKWCLLAKAHIFTNASGKLEVKYFEI